MLYLENYFAKVPLEQRSKAAIAFAASLDHISEKHPQVASAIVKELKDQRQYVKMIASENYSSLATQLAMGNWLTDKYAEGFPYHRFYAGCENVDCVESLAQDLARKIFNAEHAYVQPHSGVDANLVAFWSILVSRVQNKEIERLHKKSVDELSSDEYETIRQSMMNQKIMGMSLNSGGHLTHGFKHNLSAKMMRSVPYEVDRKTGLINYDALAQQAQREKPLILVAGYSAYPRNINFATMREIADSVGAVFMVDMAHFAGLVAGGVMKGDHNPLPFAHIVTTTTHKTLRGPRGGMVLCKQEFKEIVDKGCPLVLGGPLPHVMAAKACAFKEVDTEEFKRYAHQIVENARALAEHLIERGVPVTTHGTDNHLVVFDVFSKFGLTGRQAEAALRQAHFTVNRNAVPYDVNGAWYTSGIRLGTAAITTLGMKKEEMKQIANWIVDLLSVTRPAPGDKLEELSRAKVQVEPSILSQVQNNCSALLQRFPLYPEITLE
jgi:glycine hydroxymethyltransferase